MSNRVFIEEKKNIDYWHLTSEIGTKKVVFLKTTIFSIGNPIVNLMEFPYFGDFSSFLVEISEQLFDDFQYEN